MFLKTFQIGKIISNLEKQNGAKLVFPAIHVSKRNAGHSQWANRKGIREVNQAKKSMMIRKLQWDINKEVARSKNPNPSTNPALKAIFGEGRKNSIPQAAIENALRIAAAALTGESIHSFVYNHPLGIESIVEISTIKPLLAQANTAAVTKKFGFKFAGDAKERFKLVGTIIAEPLKNVENPFDKAVEDAITANCEEVNEMCDNLEFQCAPGSLDSCVKALTELGYKINSSDSQYIFPSLLKIDDELIIQKLEKMEEKLATVNGFVRVFYNLE